MKSCSKCSHVKPLEDFHRCKRSSTGRKSQCKDCVREYCAENSEEFSRRARKWNRQNYDKVQMRLRKWFKDNPGKAKEYTSAYRARLKQAEGRFSSKEWEALVEACGGICLCCKRSDKPLTADHIVPLFQGGSNYIENIQPLCRSCNSSKGARHIDYRPVELFECSTI